MLPSCRLLVHYVRNEEVIADQTDIAVQEEFKNKVSIKFENEEAKPGEVVNLVLKGAPNTRIAVTAIDKSIHYLAKGNDIKAKTISDIRERLTIRPHYVRNWGRCSPRHGYYRKRRGVGRYWGGGNADFVDSETAFSNVGVSFMSSLDIDVRPCERPSPIAMEIARKVGGRPGPSSAKGSKVSKTRVRKNFPETWIWTDKKLSSNGSSVVQVTVPDTITSWYASGFGISTEAGLGVAEATELRAFQPFFISLSLPYSVIREEDLTIPAVIFSYVKDTCVTIRMTLAFSQNYEMLAGPSAKACLCSGRTATVLFRIKPKKLGHIDIKVTAETLTDNVCRADKPFSTDVVAADAVIKKLLVEPEGMKEEYTKSVFFCPKNEPTMEFTSKLSLHLPKNLVPGSLFTRIQVMGDIMGSSLSNFEELLAMPYGCGEQNMLKFAPNIFIMNYLKNTDQVDEEVRAKALSYMRSGYQRELTYKHSDGSYSAFGARDKVGSTWLSAFVLKSYAQARPWIDIDENEIKATGGWLKRFQGFDGCFPTIGKLHNKAMKGGVKTPATLSAYVLIALLEAGFEPNSTPIMAGARCVTNVFKNFTDSLDTTDSYSLSIMAYLFAKLDYTTEYDQAMKYLEDKAITVDGMKHWEEKTDKSDDSTPFYYKARSTDIEQTSYVVLAILEKGGPSAVATAVPIIQWLSKQRNTLGGWSSTQDTILALQALAMFAEKSFSPGADLKINLSGSGFDFQHEFEINKDNKLVLQRVENIPVPSSVDIKGEGEGCALLQANVKYNVEKVETKPTFDVTVSITRVNNTKGSERSCSSQMLKVCTKTLGETESESNMAIIDVQMISGFTADESQFKDILISDANIKDIEIKEKSVVFYIREIKKSLQCVTFQVDQLNNVREAKPAPIKVYDYYDTEKMASVMYSFTKDNC